MRSWACRLDNDQRVPMVKHLLSPVRGRVRLLAFDQPLLQQARAVTGLETVWIIPYGAWSGAEAAKPAADHVSVGAVDLTPVVAADARGA
jgi:hypothetical protein